MSTDLRTLSSTPKLFAVQFDVPATRTKLDYVDFDDAVAAGDDLVVYIQKVEEVFAKLGQSSERVLRNCWRCDDDYAKREAKNEHDENIATARSLATELPRMRDLLTKFKEVEAFYNRPSSYDKNGHLTRRVISEQVALLLASLPTVNPGSPEVFSRMMIEEIRARKTDACVLESAMRRCRRTMKFVSITEVLDAIKQETRGWLKRAILTDGTVDEIISHWAELLEPPDLESRIAEHKAEYAALMAEREKQKQEEERRRKAQLTPYERMQEKYYEQVHDEQEWENHLWKSYLNYLKERWNGLSPDQQRHECFRQIQLKNKSDKFFKPIIEGYKKAKRDEADRKREELVRMQTEAKRKHRANMVKAMRPLLDKCDDQNHKRRMVETALAFDPDLDDLEDICMDLVSDGAKPSIKKLRAALRQDYDEEEMGGEEDEREKEKDDDDYYEEADEDDEAPADF
jgi:hypothetical protein